MPLDSCSPCVLHESQGKPKHGVQLLAVNCSDNAYALSALEKLHFAREAAPAAENPRERYMQKTFIPCSECRSLPRARATLRTAQMFKMVALESWRASNRRKEEKLPNIAVLGARDVLVHLDLEGFCHEASAHTRYAQASRSRTNSQRPVLFSSWHPNGWANPPLKITDLLLY